MDVALGAEEMVENLTEKNLQLEEELNQLTETVTDLVSVMGRERERESHISCQH